MTNPAGNQGCAPSDIEFCDAATYIDQCSPDGLAWLHCSDGWLGHYPCPEQYPPGDRCVLHPVLNTPICVDEGAVPCDPAAYERQCLGTPLLDYCDSYAYYTKVMFCEAGASCRVSITGYADCVPEEAGDCQPETFAPYCEGRNILVTCRDGFEQRDDCASWGELERRCMTMVDGNTTCGQAEECDPSTYQASCYGSMALNCHADGYLLEEDCQLGGMFTQCTVEENQAVCKSY
jgi:hypothetical protein